MLRHRPDSIGITTQNMIIFIDTEFTSLNEPYLISAGLVAEDGRELYFEMDGVSPLACSDFVVDNVLPLLEGPVLTPIEVAKQVSDYLGSDVNTVTLFCDAPRYDVELLKPFLPAKVRWQVAVPSFETEEEESGYRTAYQSAFRDGLRRHHALDDARAMQRAWQAIRLKTA